MALSAGLFYKTGFCASTAQTACSNASYTWTSYGCLGSAANNVIPTPCLLGVNDSISIPSLDALVNPSGAEYMVYGALLAFAVGFSVGHAIKYLSKFK